MLCWCAYETNLRGSIAEVLLRTWSSPRKFYFIPPVHLRYLIGGYPARVEPWFVACIFKLTVGLWKLERPFHLAAQYIEPVIRAAYISSQWLASQGDHSCEDENKYEGKYICILCLLVMAYDDEMKFG